MLVVIFHELIVNLVLGRQISTDETKLSINRSELLTGRDAEVKTLAVLDVVVDGRHERTIVKTTLQM